MKTYLTKKLKDLANHLIVAASYEHQGFVIDLLRITLRIHPASRVLLLIQAGFIRQAKSITDNKRYSNDGMQRISERINAIDLALTDWNVFLQQVGISPRIKVPKSFNWQVLMAVNSCALFDQNGYSVRSTQIKNALNEVSVQTHFCARLGYPWDMRGKGGLSQNHQVTSDEGLVWLQHDSDGIVGRTDPECWKDSAEYIKRVVNELPSKPTILHAHSKYSNGIAAAIAGRQLGVPVVYEMRGLWHLTRAQNEPTFHGSDFFNYEERMEVWAAELADAVVVISSTLKKWLMEHGVPETKITVIPNAPDSLLKPSPDSSFASTGTLRLAFMGSLASYEGIDTVIEAVSLLIAQGHKISFDIFGDGNYRKVFERQVKKLRLRDHVRFHGRVSRSSILKQVSNFDVFPIVRVESDVTRLIPPLKHLEPMAAEKVVLISSLPALLENVPECVAKHAVPPGDSQALAKKLQFLWSNPGECAHIARQSRQWVVQNRSWTKNGQSYRDLYEKIASATQN